jgi:hypothetical protein
MRRPWVFANRLLICFLATLPSLCSVQAAEGQRVIYADELYDKVRGFWLGQLIGNAAGRSTEGTYRLDQANPNESVPWVLKQQWDADDDTDIEYLGLHILETDGFACSAEALGRQWLRHISSQGIYIANRQSWFLLADGYLPPQTGSRAFNKHWYSIDSQITTEVFGVVCPGMVQAAIDLAGKFAHISNEGFPVHAAQLYAAMNAIAFFESDVATIVAKGLDAVPSSSRTHKVVSDVLQWYLDDAVDGQLDWRSTRRKLYDHYQGQYSFGRHYNWLESTINTGATIMSLLYGRGDFKDTVQIAVLVGWDCDCNPATAGGLIGVIEGYSGLPADLTAPAVCGDIYVNIFRPYLPNENAGLPQYESISNIAVRIANLAEQNIMASGGHTTGDGAGKEYHIPSQSDSIVTAPENIDPLGPCGLVRDAIESGIVVGVSAAVENHKPEDDRQNLESIIDGIKDNSYNGRKAYSSYISAAAKPARDWYQLSFSELVRFEGLTFYEGDFVWDRINDYYRYEQARGGFFQEIAVEIFKNGKYIIPANLQMDAELDPYKMYQAITFSFSPTVGSAIRVIGRAGGSMQYTTIMELEASGALDTGLYIKTVTINEGHIQRSEVSGITITFSEEVVISPQAFQIVDEAHSAVLSEESIRCVYDSLMRRVVLTFDTDSSGEFDDSLPDSLYELKLDCSKIVNAQGRVLLDEDQNPQDGYYSIAFHRLFGDVDGSGQIDLRDFSVLGGIWHDGPGLSGLDIDKDGSVQIYDLAAFGDNWLVAVK